MGHKLPEPRAFSRLHASLATLCRFIIPVMATLLAAMVAVSGHAQVTMMNCQVPDNIYVLTHSNDKEQAIQSQSMESLRRLNMSRGEAPTYYQVPAWSLMNNYYDFYHGALTVKRFSVIIDRASDNITLMMTGDHQEDDLTWTTDNMAMIDGKTSAYADFVCKDSWLGLKWHGRDLNSEVEHFDSAYGTLEAKAVDVYDDFGQSLPHLQLARLDNNYSLAGVTGQLYRLFHKYIYRSSPTRHEFHYQDAGGQPRYMNPKYNTGYHLQDPARLYVDANQLQHEADESSSQNSLRADQPVSARTLRAYLLSVGTTLKDQTSMFNGKVLGVEPLSVLIDKADEHLSNAENLHESSGQQEYTNAIGQLKELGSRVNQNLQMDDNAFNQLGEVVSAKRDLERVSKQIAMVIKEMNRSLTAIKRRATVMNQVTHTEGSPEPDFQLQSEALEIPGDFWNIPASVKGQRFFNATTAASDLPEEECAFSNNHKVSFASGRGVNLSGFPMSIEVRQKGDGNWGVMLQATETPWTYPWIQAYGSDFSIPGKSLWCRGPFFGVDHSDRTLRVSIRGVYDTVNNQIYTVSQWSVWGNWTGSWTLDSLHNIATTALPAYWFYMAALSPAGLVMGPQVMLLGAATLAAGVSMPFTTPESRHLYIPTLTRMGAKAGLGHTYHNGSLAVTYYNLFNTLVPRTSL